MTQIPGTRIEKLIQEKNLTETEAGVLHYLMEHLDTALSQGVRQVARQNFTSTSTIMRLAHKMGYSGFVDMCYKLNILSQKHDRSDRSGQLFLDRFCSSTLLNYNTYTQLKACAEQIAVQDEKLIFIYATGFSGTIGAYMSRKLVNTGRRCIFADGGESVGMFENSLDFMGMFICISKSGETILVRDKIKTAKENGVFTAAITGDRENSVSRYADLWFRIEDLYKLDDLNIMPNTFFPQALMLVELIAYEYQRICDKNKNPAQ